MQVLRGRPYMYVVAPLAGLLSAIFVARAATTQPVTQPTTHPVALRPLPTSYRPVMALALSADQKRLAAGQGDRVLIFDLAGKERSLSRELSTPRDLVQSLAWSADGNWLASGGFRSVR